jgi:hypothetical protein
MIKNRIQVLVLLCLAISFSVACSLSQLPQIFGEYPTGQGDLLFQDAFSDPASGWDRIRTGEGTTDYEADRYRIVVNASNADYWANPGLSFRDVVIDVDAGKNGGPDDNDFGILCRYQDVGNFYFLIISSDGYFGIGKVEDGQQQLLDPPQMYHAESIITGQGPNHIQASCHGSQLTLTVNGDQLAQASDGSFPEGDIGLIVGTFDEPGVDIWFDNLSVRVP